MTNNEQQIALFVATYNPMQLKLNAKQASHTSLFWHKQPWKVLGEHTPLVICSLE